MHSLAEEVMVYQKYYCPSYLYTSYSIKGPLVEEDYLLAV